MTNQWKRRSFLRTAGRTAAGLVILRDSRRSGATLPTKSSISQLSEPAAWGVEPRPHGGGERGIRVGHESQAGFTARR